MKSSILTPRALPLVGGLCLALAGGILAAHSRAGLQAVNEQGPMPVSFIDANGVRHALRPADAPPGTSQARVLLRGPLAPALEAVVAPIDAGLPAAVRQQLDGTSPSPPPTVPAVAPAAAAAVQPQAAANPAPAVAAAPAAIVHPTAPAPAVAPASQPRLVQASNEHIQVVSTNGHVQVSSTDGNARIVPIAGGVQVVSGDGHVQVVIQTRESRHGGHHGQDGESRGGDD